MASLVIQLQPPLIIGRLLTTAMSRSQGGVEEVGLSSNLIAQRQTRQGTHFEVVHIPGST